MILCLNIFLIYLWRCVVVHANDNATGDYEEYQYEEVDLTKIQNKGGGRLVGAKAARTADYPFLVGWNMFGLDNIFMCTGSLLTSRYFLSAAHCNNIVEQKKNRKAKRRECVRYTRNGKDYFHKSRMLKIKCFYLPTGDFEVRTEPKGKAWIGIDDIHANEVKNARQMSEIKRHIRHQYSYKGGGSYGNYGGHDITLLELETPFIGYKPACLPSYSFDDIRLVQHDTRLAGYGKYFRNQGQTCETNKHGKMKYHYCDDKYGDGNSACITNHPPPQWKECTTFFDNPTTPQQISSNGEEIKIIGGNKRNKICFPTQNPENPRFGWCRTRGNFYRLGEDQHRYKNGWGFCSKDCYLDESIEGSGILRKKYNVGILPEHQCEAFLRYSLQGKHVRHRPKILCIAQKMKWSEEVWKRTGSGYKKLGKSEGARRYGSTGFVASAGTCQGDSGGPAFVKDGSNFVVTGVVSGGRGVLGYCGGVNNPIHYVRVKMFTPWIQANMGEEKQNLCWSGVSRKAEMNMKLKTK